MKTTDRRELPNGKVSLTALGLGCAQMGNLLKLMPFADARDTADAAWDAGIRYFDTAPFYGFTRSERRLGAILDERQRSDFAISTKVGRLMVPDADVGAEAEGYVNPCPFHQVYDYSYDAILRSFDASQQRLGMVRFDILYVHDIGRVTHGERHEHHWNQLTKGGGFKALSELRQDGRIGGFGLGVNEWEAVSEALDECDLDVSMLAGRYTLLEQESLGLLRKCLDRGARIVVAGAFNSGVLAGNNTFNYGDAPAEIIAQVEKLRAVAAEFGVAIQAAALQFAMAHPAVVSCVSGARNARQIRSNVEWFEAEIPTGFWQALRERGLVAEGTPLPGLSG